MRTSAPFFAGAVGVTCCLLLGGATSVGFLSDTLLQLISIPLLLVSLWRLLDVPTVKQMRWPLLFFLAVILVPLLQLLPLPPRIWTALPGRAPVAATFGLLERELPWMPISMSPYATWLSALSLLPPAAVFLATLLLGYRERRMLSLVVLAVGAVSVFVGLSQVAQGPKSALRFFEITNPSEAVGFFANRNHFAALLYALTLLAAAWLVETATKSELGPRRHDTARILAIVANFFLLVVLVAAQAMARSRAGLGLTMVALFAAFALAFSGRRHTSHRTPSTLLVGAILIAVVFAIQYALYRILQRFTSDPLEDARIALARNTIAAAKTFMPFGSGMGTFVPVHAMFEKAEDAVIDAYANRAHNDVLELWLEAGAVGVGLMAIFLAWLVIRAARVWRHIALPARDVDQLLARGATVIVVLIVAHSFVDYPLRTGAMMAMFAFACGLLIEPRAGAEREALSDAGETDVRQQGARHDPSETAAVASSPRQPLSSAPSPHPGERWGEHMNWPEAWLRPGAKDRHSGPATKDSAPRNSKK